MGLFAGFSLLAALILSFSSFGVLADPAVVNLGYVQLQGKTDTTKNVDSWLSIRYAAPPVGNLRFRAPQPPLNQTGVQVANVEPPACPQAGNGQSNTNPLEQRQTATNIEDCLFLNVFSPTGAKAGSLPVMVWIHGGGYIAGNAAAFNGADFVTESNHGLVTVIIQYRLGVFGFLPGQKVKDGGALNAGLLDQDFALRWVNQHISKFGGNPSEVTIFGESAGGGSVLQQVIANGGQTKPQLFRGGIGSSPFLPSQYRFNDDVPEFLFSQTANLTNCTAAADTLDCIRKADPAVVQAANQQINKAAFFGTFIFVPVIDGTFIQQSPTQAFLQKKVNGRALMTSNNLNDGPPFVNQAQGDTVNGTQYALNLFPHLTPQQAAQAGALYAATGLSNLGQRNLIQGESIFICPAIMMVEAFPGRSWKAEFDVNGAPHGADVAFYFQSMTASLNNTDLKKAFADPFLSFAMSGNPNNKFETTITPQWDTYVAGAGPEMLFNNSGTAAVVHEIQTAAARTQRCQFWRSVAQFTGQ